MSDELWDRLEPLLPQRPALPVSGPQAVAGPAFLLTGGRRNDLTQLLPLLDAIPPVRGRVGHPRQKPDSLFADRSYDHDIYHGQVHARSIVPAIARRGTRHKSRMGTYRWVIEWTFAWLHGFRRLRIR